jgi:type II secretory pathway predicted ATPase ExeA
VASDHRRVTPKSGQLDEAHILDAEQLEGLRLLTNADLGSRSPFACLLVGQPILRRRTRLGAFAALRASR